MLDPTKPISGTARQNYDDTWSPAVQQPDQPVHYWPNITCADRKYATDRANESILRLEKMEDMLQWNVFPDILAENE